MRWLVLISILIMAGCTGSGAEKGPNVLGPDAAPADGQPQPTPQQEAPSQERNMSPPVTPSPSAPQEKPAGRPSFQIHIEHNYTENEVDDDFELPTGAGGGRISVKFVPMEVPGVGSPCAGSKARAEILDPSGHVVLDVSIGAVTVSANPECGDGLYQGDLPGGNWTASFTGQGNVRALVDAASDP